MQMADCSGVLRIGSQHTIAESYEGKGLAGRRVRLLAHEFGNVSIRFADKTGRSRRVPIHYIKTIQNPFDQRTVIGINLANEMERYIENYRCER